VSAVGTVLAIDVGATKIAAGLVDARGAVRHRRQVPTDPAHNGGDVTCAVGRLVASYCDSGSEISGVGIGSAGPIDHEAGWVSPVNIPDWRQHPLVRQIADITGHRPRLAGDAVCGALAERAVGAAVSDEWALFTVLSTGVGGGVIADGRVLTGRHGNAGLIGHVEAVRDGEPCACGARGCLEAYASGPSMVRRARLRGLDVTDAPSLVDAVRLDDSVATLVVDEAAAAFAKVVAQAMGLLEIQAVVVGGGVMRAGEVMLRRLQAAVDAECVARGSHPLPVRVAALGDDACLVGAGMLVHRPDLVSLPEDHTS
jgi:glucokinase